MKKLDTHEVFATVGRVARSVLGALTTMVGGVARRFARRPEAVVERPPPATPAAAAETKPGEEQVSFEELLAKRGVEIFDHEHDHGYVPRAGAPVK